MKTEYEYSVIIPVYNHWDLTAKCLDSVRVHSARYNCEIVVVSNGSTDNTPENLAYIQRNGVKNLSYYCCTEPLGGGPAINLGFRVAKGRYLITVNNDTAILNESWISILREPFNDPNRKVGITGPLKLYSSEANCEFIVFFCAMISADVGAKYNFLSEDFGWGYGEDIDLAKRMQKDGYEVVMVPEKFALKPGHDGMWDGGFPIYHKGEETVGEIPNWQGITEDNRKKLNSIYGGLKHD